MREYTQASKLRNTLFGGVGSIWSESTDPTTRTQLRRMLSGLNLPATFGVGLETIETLTDVGTYAQDYVFLDAEPNNVKAVDQDLATEMNAVSGGDWFSVFSPLDPYAHDSMISLYEGGLTLATTSGQILLWPDQGAGSAARVRAEESVPTWILGTDPDYRAHRIQAQDGSWLIRGVDFQSEYGVVVLYQDPSVVFPKQKALSWGRRRPVGPYNYSLMVDEVRTPGYWVWYYYRNGQSLLSFKRALAEASGVHVWYHDSYITSVRELPVGAAYTTTQETVWAGYPHTVLGEGVGVTRGDVLCDDADFQVEINSGTLEINLYEPLFSGTFLSRAQEFANRSHPLTLPLVLTAHPDT